eukprot:2727525-Alexandrium_andersonii.AAC.1
MDEGRIVQMVMRWRPLEEKSALVRNGTARRRAWTGHSGRGRPRMWEELLQTYLDIHHGPLASPWGHQAQE